MTRTSTCITVLLPLYAYVESSSSCAHQETQRKNYPCKCLQSLGGIELLLFEPLSVIVSCGFYSIEQVEHAAYLQWTGLHFFDAITAPSLCTEQVISSDPLESSRRTSLFSRVLLMFIKPLCQLFWPLPVQVKLKSVSHFSGQVSTQDKVRFSPPRPYCGVTAKTNMRHEKRCFNSRSTVNVVQFCVSPHHRGHAVWLCWTLFSHQWTLNNGNPQRPEHSLSEWAAMGFH